MTDEATQSKKRTVSELIANLTKKMMANVETDRANGFLNRDKFRKALGKPEFHIEATELLSKGEVSFATVLKKHLHLDGHPISRAEYLFLVYVIQNGAYEGQQASKERLIELLQLEKELLDLYVSGFPDEHYIITNLISYRSQIGKNRMISEALDKLLEVTERNPTGTMLHLDLPARNLLALLEESNCLDEISFSEVVSRYTGTLVTLASRAIYEERSGSLFPFRDYFASPVSVVEQGGFFSLQVMSNASGFLALLELKGSPKASVPLHYRHFSALAGSNNLLLQEIPGEYPADFVLKLSDGIRVYLTSEEAESLRSACQRVRGIEEFRSHEVVLSFLSGTAI